MTEKIIERRSSERLQIRVPIRVLNMDLAHIETGGFSEDTSTVFVSHSGASLTLRNSVVAGDSLRIINLTDLSEADFRVVGGLGSTEDGAGIWAVECLERRDNFWGVECPPASGGVFEDTHLLHCRACRQKINHRLTLMESEVYKSAGVVVLECEPCGKPTYWVDADSIRSPGNFLEAETTAPPERAREKERKGGIEDRINKRSRLNLVILVRNQGGDQELSKTVDISKSGMAVNLFMKLNIGDTVKFICPYDPRSGGIEQTAEVRWRTQYYNQDFPQTYGLRSIR